MVLCCVPFCKSRSGKSKGISFHDFPSDHCQKQKWLKVISRDNFTPNANSFCDSVCSLHFQDCDYKPGLKRRCLKPLAVPSVFSKYPSYKVPKVAPSRYKIIRSQETMVESTESEVVHLLITATRLPKAPLYAEIKGKALPPKPSLKGSKNPTGGITLSWDMCLFKHHATVASYQLFAYQEIDDGPMDASLWKKVGDINAVPLPMACTLTQFIDRNRYWFTVRAVDVHHRVGPFSNPVGIFYEKDNDCTQK